jgi:predicted nucleic acid-binding protein
MRLMIDTNIFLDVLTRREPFFSPSKAVLELCEGKKVQGFLSASSVTDIFYLIRRQYHDAELAYRALGSILDIVKVLTVTNDDVLNAYLARAADFEDCLLATCAKSNHCEAIVTRNKKDFLTFGITLLSPEEVSALFPGGDEG